MYTIHGLQLFQIALQDTKTWTPEDKESDELILYFLLFAPNQIFSRFVSGRHLDRIGRLRGDDIEFDGLWQRSWICLSFR